MCNGYKKVVCLSVHVCVNVCVSGGGLVRVNLLHLAMKK